jgi:hypothetical protein
MALSDPQDPLYFGMSNAAAGYPWIVRKVGLPEK